MEECGTNKGPGSVNKGTIGLDRLDRLDDVLKTSCHKRPDTEDLSPTSRQERSWSEDLPSMFEGEAPPPPTPDIFSED